MFSYTIENLHFIPHFIKIQTEDAGQSTLRSFFNGIPVVVHRVDKSKGSVSNMSENLVHAVTHGNLQPRKVSDRQGQPQKQIYSPKKPPT